jgi:hypothetical protein
MAFRAHLTGGDLDEGFSVVPAIEYWRFRFDQLGVRASQSDFTMGADVRYRFPVSKAWHPYLGAGLGFHLIHVTVDATGQPKQFANPRKLAPGILFGVDLPAASFIQSSIEANYQMVSDYRQFKINYWIGVKL